MPLQSAAIQAAGPDTSSESNIGITLFIIKWTETGAERPDTELEKESAKRDNGFHMCLRATFRALLSVLCTYFLTAFHEGHTQTQWHTDTDIKLCEIDQPVFQGHTHTHSSITAPNLYMDIWSLECFGRCEPSNHGRLFSTKLLIYIVFPDTRTGPRNMSFASFIVV